MTDNAIVALAQVIAPLLSVPIVATALLSLFRFALPTSRLASRLTRDLAIYEKLPESDEKKLFGAIIDSTLAQMNVRLAPAVASKRRQIWLTVWYSFVMLLGLSIAAVAIVTFFSLIPALSGPATVMATVVGLLGTMAAATFLQVRRTRETIETSQRVESVARAMASEQWILDLVKRFGLEGASSSAQARDLGHDISTDLYVIEVKNSSRPIGPAAVRELAQSATSHNKKAILFATSNVTREALRSAEMLGVGLIRFNLEEESVEGLNGLGQAFIEGGAEETPPSG